MEPIRRREDLRDLPCVSNHLPRPGLLGTRSISPTMAFRNESITPPEQYFTNGISIGLPVVRMLSNFSQFGLERPPCSRV